VINAVNFAAFQCGWFVCVLGAALGAIRGPLSYVRGERLGAISFHHQASSLMARAIGWAVLTPLLLRLAQRHDGCLRELHVDSKVAARHA
jgi:integral membrane sensor domain MASE1